MARTFRRQRSSHPIAELNVTNLIDLGFTLLIIFMIATPLINQEQSIPVNLPTESKSQQIKPDKNTKFVSLTVDPKGTFFIDNVAVSQKDLTSRLRTLASEANPPVIRIRADGTVPYQKVVTLLDELKKSNLSKITFDTQAP
jgi:biopolymer transport protein ExbD